MTVTTARTRNPWVNLCQRSLVLIALVGSLLSVRPARACSGPECIEADFLPHGGQVPASLPAVLWFPGSGRFNEDDAGARDAAELRFVRLDGDAAVPVPFQLVERDDHFQVVPDAPLQAGAEYVVWSRACGDDALPEEPPLDRLATDPDEADLELVSHGEQGIGKAIARFETTQPVALPGELGALSASDTVTTTVERGGGAGCWYDLLAATVDIAPAEPSPWHDALRYETRVDGEVFRPSSRLGFSPRPGGSWRGHGVDTLYSACDWEQQGFARQPALEAGTHRVQMVATLPGVDGELRSESVEVTLRCDAVAAPSDAGAAGDAAVADADGRGPTPGTDTGATGPDPDAGADPATDGPAADAPAVEDDGAARSSSSSGCSVGEGRSPGAPAAAALALLWGALWTRRRRG